MNVNTTIVSNNSRLGVEQYMDGSRHTMFYITICDWILSMIMVKTFHIGIWFNRIHRATYTYNHPNSSQKAGSYSDITGYKFSHCYSIGHDEIHC